MAVKVKERKRRRVAPAQAAPTGALFERCRTVDLTGPVEGMSARWLNARKLAVARGVPLKYVKHPSDIMALEHGCYWDWEAGLAVPEWLRTFCCHYQGELAGQPLILAPWQLEEIAYPLYSWMRPDGSRRFRVGYVAVPGKNGKSTVVGGLALYHLTADGERGAEVVNAAGDEKQARVVFKTSTAMVENSPVLDKRLQTYEGSIIYRRGTDVNTMMVLTSKASTKHGLNCSAMFADELHVWQKRDLWDVLRSRGKSRRQPLLLAITTAGDDLESVCYEVEQYARDVLNGVVEDDSFFVFISAAESKDPWDRLETWIRANPGLELDHWIEADEPSEVKGERPVRLSAACPFKPTGPDAYLRQLQRWCRGNPGYGASPRLDALVDEALAAVGSPAKINAFRQTTLNQWVQDADAFIDLDLWDACAGAVDLEALRGRVAYAAFDLSARDDVTALAVLFPPLEWVEKGRKLGPSMSRKEEKRRKEKAERAARRRGGAPPMAGLGTNANAIEADPTSVEEPWILKLFYWVPEKDLIERGRDAGVDYAGWVEKKILRTCPGAVVDARYVQRELLELGKLFELVDVSGDPWNGAFLMASLAEYGVQVAEVPLLFINVGQATKELLNLVKAVKLVHEGDPMTRWMISNLVVEKDTNLNLRPAKKKSEKKIDGPCAGITAFSRALRFFGLRRKRVGGVIAEVGV